MEDIHHVDVLHPSDGGHPPSQLNQSSPSSSHWLQLGRLPILLTLRIIALARCVSRDYVIVQIGITKMNLLNGNTAISQILMFYNKRFLFLE